VKDKQIIGRSDYFDFPELGLLRVPSKIDTGAYTNVMHCSESKVENNVLFFKIADHPNFKLPQDKWYKSTKFETRNVRSSNGQAETRYTVFTNVKILDQNIETEFTLTDRKEMEVPVLIGRICLDKFLVDVTLTNVSFKNNFKSK
jgi:hypothetical protein